jgi:hypothetical protein
MHRVPPLERNDVDTPWKEYHFDPICPKEEDESGSKKKAGERFGGEMRLA